jgi:hypothetical protein
MLSPKQVFDRAVEQEIMKKKEDAELKRKAKVKKILKDLGIDWIDNG